MPGRQQASLARRTFLHVDPIRYPSEKVSNGVENVFSPTTQASGFPMGIERGIEIGSYCFWQRNRLKQPRYKSKTLI